MPAPLDSQAFARPFAAAGCGIHHMLWEDISIMPYIAPQSLSFGAMLEQVTKG